MRAGRKGLLFALLASLFVSIASALVKSSTLPIGQTSFIASFLIFTISSLFALYRHECFFPKGQRLRLVAFSLLSGLVTIWDYEAMRLMPLGDEVVASYTSVVFTILLAKVFLKETCGRSKVFCAAFIIIGVGMISKSDGSASGTSLYPKYRFGLLLTLFAAFFDATTYIFIKELSGLHFSVVLLNYGGASMVLTGPMFSFENWRMPSEPFTLGLIGILSLLQELFLYWAVMEGEETSLISLVQASDIVFSYLWEVSFFSEPHTLLRILGAAFVSCGVCLAALASDCPETRMEGSSQSQEEEELPLFEVETGEKLKKVTMTSSKQIIKWSQPL